MTMKLDLDDYGSGSQSIWSAILQQNEFVVILGGTLLGVAACGGTIWIFRKFGRKWSNREGHLLSSKKTTGDMITSFPGALSMENFKRYKGLKNVGNSCYLNCILQALASVVDKLPLEITPEARLPREPSNGFCGALHAVLWELNEPITIANNGGPVSLDALMTSMGGRLNWEQQDAHELLQAILNVLGKYQQSTINGGLSTLVSPYTTMDIGADTNNTSNHAASKFSSLLPWEGLMISTITCTACGVEFPRRDISVTTFSILTLNPLAESLEDCLLLTYSPVFLHDYHCKRCESENTSYKTEKIVRWPTILMIHIQRSTMHGLQLAKDDCQLQFPLRMTVSSVNGQAPQEMHSSPHAYELTAVVEHLGRSLHSGHYITLRQVQENSGQRWLYCSDQTVRATSYEKVLKANPYILFYRKIR